MFSTQTRRQSWHIPTAPQNQKPPCCATILQLNDLGGLICHNPETRGSGKAKNGKQNNSVLTHSKHLSAFYIRWSWGMSTISPALLTYYATPIIMDKNLKSNDRQPLTGVEGNLVRDTALNVQSASNAFLRARHFGFFFATSNTV